MMARWISGARGSSGSSVDASGCDSTRRRMRPRTDDRWPVSKSDEFQPARGKEGHAHQEPSVRPAPDVGLAVHPFAIPDRQFDDLERLARRAEKQIEIAKRIELAEVGAVTGDGLIRPSPT